MVRIAPSILSADFACLGTEITRIAPAANLLHVDVMDGHFVPNLTIGPPVVEAIHRHSQLYLDCHLMMTDPGEYLEAFKRAGADHCSVHVEVGETRELIDQMRGLGLDAGLAINPETPFEAVEPWLDQVDLVLVMTVHPGFGGQTFMSEVVPKIAQVARAAAERAPELCIEVDGGIDADTVRVVAEAGADTFVAGSAIFGHDDPVAAAEAIRRAAQAASSSHAGRR